MHDHKEKNVMNQKFQKEKFHYILQRKKTNQNKTLN